MTHSDYQELLVGYAVNALEPDEARAVDEHLTTCTECDDEVNSLRDTSALLSHAAPPQAPGADVRSRTLATVRAESQPEPASAQAQVVQMPQRATRGWPNLLRVAAAIAFIVLLAGVIALWRRETRMRSQMADLAQQLETVKRERERERDQMLRQQEALALFNSANARKVQLTGTETAQTARGTLMFDQQTGRAVLLTEGLPATTPDKAYEVWFIPKGRAPMPGKVFTVDASGHAMVTDQMPPEAMNNAVIAITIEPRNGSATPTGAIYLSSPAS